MAWNRTGTATATNGSVSVTGTLTAWLVSAKIGDMVTFDGGLSLYEVATIPSNTSMTLATNFGGTTGAKTGASGLFAIIPASPNWVKAGEISLSISQLLERMILFPVPIVGDALKIPQVNSGGTGYQFADTASVFDPYTSAAAGYAAAAAASAASAALKPYGQNLLINGDFAINQRAFAGGALATGVYSFDRWKSGPSPATISVAAGVVTLSGEIVQIIECELWGLMTFDGAPLTVSVDTPSHDIYVVLGNAAGVITAGAGRRSVILTPVGSGSQATLSLQRSGGVGSVTFKDVKVEPGSIATAFLMRPTSVERALCNRYAFFGPSNGYILGYADSATAWMSQYNQFPVAMRAIPTLSFSNPHNANASLAVLVGGFQPGSTVPGSANVLGCNAYVTNSAGSMTVGGVYLAQGQINAVAEL